MNDADLKPNRDKTKIEDSNSVWALYNILIKQLKEDVLTHMGALLKD